MAQFPFHGSAPGFGCEKADHGYLGDQPDITMGAHLEAVNEPVNVAASNLGCLSCLPNQNF